MRGAVERLQGEWVVDADLKTSTAIEDREQGRREREAAENGAISMIH